MDEEEIEFIIPAYNEALNIKETASMLAQEFPASKILVVDDGSEDRTAEICKENGVSCIKIEHAGYGAASRKGFENARGKYLVLTDADLPYEPALMRDVIARIKDEDMILLERNQNTNTITRRFLSEAYRRVCALLVNKDPATNDVNGIKIMKKSALADIDLRTQGWLLSTEIVYKFKKKNKRIKTIKNFNWIKRRKDKSKVTVGSAVRLFADLVRLRLGHYG